ncbi:twin-arginine translocase TatA/TatE family subunit [uncultured Enterovirga sp.]|uniref:twin-arginine translocase TatA/TatE family subunit n=1 Tax=uncultured Enterovirga sp. TaxID=2026352 RepID=UPI0035CBA751
MGGASIWHWIVVGLLIMVFFGRGKLSEIMGDAAKGIKAFKRGMAEDDTAAATAPTTAPTAAHAEPVRTLEHRNEPVATSATTTLADRKLG